MAPVVMYSTGICPYCIRARMLFDAKGVEIEDIRVDLEPSLRAVMEEKSGRHTVPQIWIGDRHIGGFSDLWALESQGQLDALLSPNS